MRLLIFCLLVSFCLCDDHRYFRFTNAISIKGNENPRTLSGTLRYWETPNDVNVWFNSMDYSTMTALQLVLKDKIDLTIDTKLDLYCSAAQDGRESEVLSGYAYLRFYSGGSELEAECYTQTGDLWTFKSFSTETKKQYYPQKEAGFRAKFLIDQPKSKYGPSNVIGFAIEDNPYFYDSCERFSRYSDAPGPEAGAVMLGKDEKHCAILDDEGTKFIHTNPVAGKVTYESIAVAERYFPNGVLYKRWPDF